jgi:hypothetical protein
VRSRTNPGIVPGEEEVAMKSDRKPKPILVNGKPIRLPISWKVDDRGNVIAVRTGSKA